MREWFDFAFKFWEFSKTFDGINNYSTLAEKREDVVLLKKLQELVEVHLEQDWAKIVEYLTEQLEIIFCNNEESNLTRFDFIHNKLKDKINEKYDRSSRAMTEEFEKFC